METRGLGDYTKAPEPVFMTNTDLSTSCPVMRLL